MTPENSVKKAILDYLLAHRVFAWRNNSGGVKASYGGKERFFRFGAKGSGDIFALYRGTFYSIEAKAPGKKPTEDQLKWMRGVIENEGDAGYFDNIDAFIHWWECMVKNNDL